MYYVLYMYILHIHVCTYYYNTLYIILYIYNAHNTLSLLSLTFPSNIPLNGAKRMTPLLNYSLILQNHDTLDPVKEMGAGHAIKGFCDSPKSCPQSFWSQERPQNLRH